VKFDNAQSNMSILAKLFPNNDQVAQIEAQLIENESIRAELTTALDQIKELQTQIEDKVQIAFKLSEAEAKVTEFETKASELETKIAELEKEVLDVDAKASIKASELLATAGHSEPVNLNNDTLPVDHVSVMSSLSPEEKTKYYNQHQKEIKSQLIK
jgi:chromosome segregation ATPase